MVKKDEQKRGLFQDWLNHLNFVEYYIGVAEREGIIQRNADGVWEFTKDGLEIIKALSKIADD